MEEKKSQSISLEEGVNQMEVPSPSEKIEDDAPTGSLVPGAQNPESEQVKEETNPNTE